jgi:hypothetical protein
MNQLALWIVTGVQVGTVAVTFISVLGDDSPEMLLVTMRMSLGLLAFISCAIVAIFHIFPFFELFELKFLFVGFKLLELFLNSHFVLVFEKRRGT